ncbi:MAG: CynX/NimT family MFS transporter, partial [Peptococcaceae bacterium]
IGMLPLSLYMTPVMETLEIRAGSFSLLFTILSLGCTITALTATKLFQRYGIERILKAGGICYGIGYLLFARANSLPVLYGSGFLMGIGIILAVTLIPQILVTNWFVRWRGAILGVVAASTGLASAVCSPVIAKLINSCGWRFAASGTGFLLIVIFLTVGVFLVREKPEQAGLTAFGAGDEQAVTAEKDRITEQNTAKAVPHNAVIFWSILICYFLIGFSNQSVMTQMSAMIIDKGFSLEISAIGVSLYAIAGMLNNVVTGLISDRWGFKWGCVYCGAGFTAACFCMTAMDTCAAVLAFSFLAGMWHTMSQMYGVMAVTAVFGAEAVLHLNGYAQTALAIGCMAGPAFTGYVYTALGSYAFTYIIFIALACIAVSVTCMLCGRKGRTQFS